MESKKGNFRWFTDYLLQHSAIVSYGKSSFKTSDIQSRVPQGSILGSLLFMLFIDDISDVTEGARIVKYADDTVICVADKNQTAQRTAKQSGLLDIMYL